MGEANFSELGRLFTALGDKTRLRLLALMSGGEVSVNFLAKSSGESQPKVSRHLAYLRNAGVVNTRRDGKWIYYSISSPSDESIGRILASVIQYMTVMRSEDGDEFAAVFPAPATGNRDNIYAQTDIIVGENESLETDIYEDSIYVIDGAERREPDGNEIDVFLL